MKCTCRRHRCVLCTTRHNTEGRCRSTTTTTYPDPKTAADASMYPNVGSDQDVSAQTVTQALVDRAESRLSNGRLTRVSSCYPPNRIIDVDLGSPSRNPRDMVRSAQPVRTAIIDHVPTSSRRRGGFDALTRTSVPIPHLFDEMTDDRKFTRVDISHWENQVKKVVPRRPVFVVTSDSGPANLYDWDINDDFVTDTKCHFYHSKKYQRDRDFVINPEWVSESVSLKSGPKAYRTCPIRYGWCS
ncbi:uncharacterized protein LOC124253415 isoform X3 [Haliotis rubra]|uniref:uncharacterized protein LOC124253415 isoform X3 n=1 Tax=Haliotis rubra TaxID=36100 RepID=UPI001EE5A0FE|nr:uncharacterized protein LOC124253415 isoform X3 [Haliotis rubra]